MRTIQLILKRIIDIFISLIGLMVISPIFLLIYIMIYFKLGSPVFFIQKRPGKNEKIFKMIKFRTMLDVKDENGKLLPDKKRLTSFGKFLRSSSLDELPELINVLKGEMSLVGPRPLLVEYLPRYNEHQARRHEMRPGITGLAQVNGRNTISWEDKFDYDVKYIDNFSLLLDLKIIIKTFFKVFKREDINNQDHATMSKFKGDQE
ncbi:Sugar transferase involved in LPS biosynthesis (colanic, teichoic acid) [Halanaerobium congolense]|uniref:Sugar transferase involved in LPS biosynthesis (Colanic, teichoic acid) n=1 Tax=Halanaerobium congolense TaxID=54121 RepID=A0A1M7NEK2_9FIRM|nr:sugar transferase [Halanaerobium congolense]PUU90722.1 MAG: UDP-galactose phosphate transferase [Halanaerobium sp.]SDJ01203.1 Sugar transferase involved in LPS biosynthesis (colanic, teichoic acid) [Halanaerobium congolense]SET67687.1 Sugar transferase involved in LPS biosynthesis (colanic, teichoic acid) [Halanaerobium congolense]SHN02076.1 Sugar transferase involved in LPS biosynthesis (colanic, teichoic acid) [Halanaerobium congolense]